MFFKDFFDVSGIGPFVSYNVCGIERVVIDPADRPDILFNGEKFYKKLRINICLLYTSPSPRDGLLSRMPSSA